MKQTARHLLQRAFDHVGEALVGVKNRCLRRQRNRPFVHGFNEDPVGVIGTFERENLRTGFTGHHHRIHFTAANGVEGCFRLGQTHS